MGFLSRRPRRKGPQLALRGESPAFPPVVVGFLSGSDGTTLTRSWCLWGVQSPGESQGVQWDSSSVAARAEVLIWI